jgi:hypothetical protein
MADKAWKAFERRVSGFFGGERNPLSGGNGKHTRADVIHPDLFIECKQRASHAVLRTWDEADKQAKKENRLPVVVLGEKNRPGFWIVCKEEDFLAVSLSLSRKRESGDR